MLFFFRTFVKKNKIKTNMPEPLKNMLNPKSVKQFALTIQSVYNPFPVENFLKSTIDKTWDDLELKARGRKITENLGKHLPQDYKKAIGIINDVLDKSDFAEKTDAFFPFCFCDFVEVFGQDEKHWDTSMKALEKYTQYSSSEWAVRPFIINHEKRMMEQMYAWSKHKNEHVRRLSSEGCRPALPWTAALNSFKKDPSPILPILEQLKTDSSLYVRKSVANNINDISKTHPELVTKLAKKWYGKHEHTDWIVKHACRTLLKQGNREVLAIFGYDDVNAVKTTDFKLEKKSISIGDDLTFSFTISVKEATKVRLEYGIDYVKSTGKRNRKIFQISEPSLKANEKKCYTKKHSFEDVSTRKHYSGIHSITLIVNGAEQGTLDFKVI